MKNLRKIRGMDKSKSRSCSGFIFNDGRYLRVMTENGESHDEILSKCGVGDDDVYKRFKVIKKTYFRGSVSYQFHVSKYKHEADISVSKRLIEDDLIRTEMTPTSQICMSNDIYDNKETVELTYGDFQKNNFKLPNYIKTNTFFG